MVRGDVILDITKIEKITFMNMM